MGSSSCVNKDFRVEVWSRPFLALVLNLMGGSGPTFLGGRVLDLDLIMSCIFPQRFLHHM